MLSDRQSQSPYPTSRCGETFSQDGFARANRVPQHGRWTEAEHKRFLEGLRKYNKDWRMIEEHIGTRTCSQIRSHAQKFFMRLQKQQQELRGQGLEDDDQQIFNDLETLYKYGDNFLTMKHRKRPLDLGDNESGSSGSCATPQQSSSAKRKRTEATDRQIAESAHS